MGDLFSLIDEQFLHFSQCHSFSNHFSCMDGHFISDKFSPLSLVHSCSVVPQIIKRLSHSVFDDKQHRLVFSQKGQVSERKKRQFFASLEEENQYLIDLEGGGKILELEWLGLVGKEQIGILTKGLPEMAGLGR
jgi:hypothetical protein